MTPRKDLPVFCSQCGTRLRTGARFCAECGAIRHQETASAPIIVDMTDPPNGVQADSSAALVTTQPIIGLPVISQVTPLSIPMKQAHISPEPVTPGYTIQSYGPTSNPSAAGGPGFAFAPSINISVASNQTAPPPPPTPYIVPPVVPVVVTHHDTAINHLALYAMWTVCLALSALGVFGISSGHPEGLYFIALALVFWGSGLAWSAVGRHR